MNKYEQSINDLLNRYSKDNETVFELVNNLKDYDGYSGIYVLCFDKEQKVYIGQAKKSIYKRIHQHFNNPQTTFDKTHDFEEISRIYVLHTTDEFIGYVERDCIAMFSCETCCNVLMGEHSIDCLRFVNPSDYLMSIKFVQGIVNDVPLAKKISADEIYNKQWHREGKKAEKTIKSISDDKKTYELCKTAINFNGDNLAYVPERFKTAEFCMLAIGWANNSYDLIQYIPEQVLTEDFAINLVKYDRRFTKVLPKHLKTEAVMTAAGYRKKKK
jgi:hypothetical protein